MATHLSIDCKSSLLSTGTTVLGGHRRVMGGKNEPGFMTAGGRGLWDGWLCMQRITDISVMLAASTPIARCFSRVHSTYILSDFL